MGRGSEALVSEGPWETWEDMVAAQGPWVFYLITRDGEFVELGSAPTSKEAETLMHDYYGRDGIPEGHPHRFFRSMGVTSTPGLEYVLREHGAVRPES